MRKEGTFSGKGSVDWKKFIECEDRDQQYYGEEYEKMVDDLLNKGILSLESKGNYQLIGSGVFVSPRSHGLIRLYFTRMRDAETYAKLNFAGAMYEVTVDKVEKELDLRRKKR